MISCFVLALTQCGIAPSMAGYAARKEASEGTEQDLFAKALMLEDRDGKRGVFCRASECAGHRPALETGRERPRHGAAEAAQAAAPGSFTPRSHRRLVPRVLPENAANRRSIRAQICRAF